MTKIFLTLISMELSKMNFGGILCLYIKLWYKLILFTLEQIYTNYHQKTLID